RASRHWTRKDDLRSMRSCSRAPKSSERGYALIAALVLAILYFAMVELLLLDSSRELAEARRFRARIVAETLAENGAELAALDMVTTETTETAAEDWQGSIVGRMARNADGSFDIEGEGKTSGLAESKAKVLVRGRIVGNDVRVQYTVHTH
ncbi:MAG TPA: hypothetical protein VM733_18030, partial [Thermoanaerobaculia bacterium]|nr:hypothetical protein [Thermoanaerobaculia bacterium]